MTEDERIRAGAQAGFHGASRGCFASGPKRSGAIPSRAAGSVARRGLRAKDRVSAGIDFGDGGYMETRSIQIIIWDLKKGSTLSRMSWIWASAFCSSSVGLEAMLELAENCE